MFIVSFIEGYSEKSFEIKFSRLKEAEEYAVLLQDLGYAYWVCDVNGNSIDV